MTGRTTTLLVGATGLLGGEILSLLLEEGRSVRALVRPGADPGKREAVARTRVETALGDLKDSASLRSACAGASVVISTATTTRSRQAGDSIASVDEEGQLALVDAAARSGVAHFVYVSFPPVSVDYALQRAKRRVEASIRGSGMSFTILQPVKFCEVWLTPALRAASADGRPTIFGLSEGLVSWVTVRDVARFAAAATATSPLAGQVLPLGGPEALGPSQLVELLDELGAPKVKSARFSRADCDALRARAASPLEEAYFAGLLSCIEGQVVNPERATSLLPGRLGTVREYAMRAFGTT
jgi:NADH dehydrogenase